MEKSETLIVKKPLLSWIFKGNRNLKLLLVITVFVTVFLRIIPLEMQKRIVNQAIKLKAFELLLIYCSLYLAAVVIVGGQGQKIAIGRALLKKPKVFIMDEATSGLDNRSQARIQSLLDSHWKGKTTLIAVVHRLDIIKGYDKIGMMKSGKIEEMGTDEELIVKKGLLYELVAGKR